MLEGRAGGAFLVSVAAAHVTCTCRSAGTGANKHANSITSTCSELDSHAPTILCMDRLG